MNDLVEKSEIRTVYVPLQFDGLIDYKPSEKSDEEVMLEVENKVFSRVIPHMRNKALKMTTSTYCEKNKEGLDTGVAVCTIILIPEQS